MIMTVKLKADIKSCIDIRKILIKNNISYEKLFENQDDIIVVNDTTTEIRRLIKNCSDVLNIIIDREVDVAL